VASAERFRAAEQRVRDTYDIDAVERWIDLEHPDVRVRVQDAGEGPPVVWVNGISNPGMTFASLVARLPGRRHLILDLPGHALAPPYGWQGAPVRELAVEILVGVLDGLGIERAVFVGNSLGGMFTLWVALDAPARIGGGVIIGQPAVAFAAARGNVLMLALTTPVLGRAAQWALPLPVPRPVARQGLAAAVGRPAAKAVSDDELDLFLLAMQLPGQAASFRSLQRRLLRGRVPRQENVLTAAELASFTVPLLFVWGAEDRFLSAAAGRASVDAIPSAQLEVVPGGHDPWLDDAERCAEVITAWPVWASA
jgi:pimeloyl-ACP methyl ester carboxylesterase